MPYKDPEKARAAKRKYKRSARGVAMRRKLERGRYGRMSASQRSTHLMGVVGWHKRNPDRVKAYQSRYRASPRGRAKLRAINQCGIHHLADWYVRKALKKAGRCARVINYPQQLVIAKRATLRVHRAIKETYP